MTRTRGIAAIRLPLSTSNIRSIRCLTHHDGRGRGLAHVPCVWMLLRSSALSSLDRPAHARSGDHCEDRPRERDVARIGGVGGRRLHPGYDMRATRGHDTRRPVRRLPDPVSGYGDRRCGSCSDLRGRLRIGRLSKPVPLCPTNSRLHRKRLRSPSGRTRATSLANRRGLPAQPMQPPARRRVDRGNVGKSDGQ